MTILYNYHNAIYVNMTNRCPCACTFCLRQFRDSMDGSDSLWLEREPTVDEVIELFSQANLNAYREIVFCGFGEPTERIHDIVKVCDYLRKITDRPIRINTNGLGSLIHNEDITPLFEKRFDTVSISLNTPNAIKYNELTRSKFKEAAFEGMLTFAKDVRKHVKNVIMTTVSTTLTSDEEKECHKICDDLGVTYRIRPYEE